MARERGAADRTVMAPGIRVARRTEGAPGGTPILLLHGFTGSVEAWGEEILGGLSPVAPVLAVDLPGHGESEAPPDPARCRMERVVEDLSRVVEEAGHLRADWIGYSMGGRVALAAAILRPERVRRLVLESASPGLRSPAERARRRRRDEALARRLEAGGMEAFVDFWLAQPLFRSQRDLPPAVRRDARRRRLGNDPRALAAVLRGLGTGSQPSFWERLGKASMEALLLTGERDPKFGALADEMATMLPRARHLRIPTAGHAVHLEAPDRWLEAVVPFLRATPPPPG